jgi:hypothetical protein
MRKLLLAGVVAVVGWVPVASADAASMGLFGQCDTEKSKVVSGPSKLDPGMLDMFPVGGANSQPYQCNRAIVTMGAKPLDVSRVVIQFLQAGVDGTTISLVGRGVPWTVNHEQEVIYVEKMNLESTAPSPATGACLLRFGGPAIITGITCEASIADEVWQTTPRIVFTATSETDIP